MQSFRYEIGVLSPMIKMKNVIELRENKDQSDALRSDYEMDHKTSKYNCDGKGINRSEKRKE
jgi:hypothetical protein